MAKGFGHTRELVDEKEYPLKEIYILCRCCSSKAKPFCEGTHCEIGFDGSKTASRKPYPEKAEIFEGPEMKLTDVHEFCALSRLCLRSGEIRNLIRHAKKRGFIHERDESRYTQPDFQKIRP
jgi:CDGSH-type Zn-finger protein